MQLIPQFATSLLIVVGLVVTGNLNACQDQQNGGFDSDSLGTEILTSDLESKLKELRDSLNDVQEKLVNQGESQQRPELKSSSADRIVPKSYLLDGIYRDIHLLKQLVDEKNKDHDEIETNSQQPRAAPSSKIDADLAATLGSDAANMRNENDNNSANKETNLNQTFFVSAKRVLPGVVDQIELGNSLYMAGHLEQAIEAYQNVKSSRVNTFDRVWTQYMTACCYRGIGDLDKAEAIYREIANDRNSVRFSESARDWLDHVSRRKTTIRLVQEYSEKADNLMAIGKKLHDEFKSR